MWYSRKAVLARGVDSPGQIINDVGVPAIPNLSLFLTVLFRHSSRSCFAIFYGMGYILDILVGAVYRAERYCRGRVSTGDTADSACRSNHPAVVLKPKITPNACTDIFETKISVCYIPVRSYVREFLP